MMGISTIRSERRETHLQDGFVELQIPPLRSPGFPVELGGFVALHAPFFTEGRTRGLVGDAWQEIRVRFGRDDKGKGCALSRHW